MSKPVIVLIALTLVSSAASAYFWNELRSERESAEQLEQRIAQLEQLPTQPAPAPIAAPAQVAVSEPQPSANPPEPKAPPRTDAAQAQATFAIVGNGTRMSEADSRRFMLQAREQQRRLMQDPEYRELMRAQQRHSMNHMYGDLEIMLGLSKEESERLRDLVADQQMRHMENSPAFMLAPGVQPDQAKLREYQQRAEEIRRKNEGEIAALLGARYPEWQIYQENSGARMQVTQLRQALATTDEPLRPDQVKPLVDAVAREQKQVEQAARMQTQPYASRQMDAAARIGMQEEWLERRAQSNERIRDAVSGLLSPSQLERLTQQQDQEIKMQQVHLRMQRAQEEARARGELPAESENAAMLGVANAISSAN